MRYSHLLSSEEMIEANKLCAHVEEQRKRFEENVLDEEKKEAVELSKKLPQAMSIGERLYGALKLLCESYHAGETTKVWFIVQVNKYLMECGEKVIDKVINRLKTENVFPIR